MTDISLPVLDTKLVTLFDALSKSLGYRGFEKTIEVLDKVQLDPDEDYRQQLIALIVFKVCESYQCTIQELKSGGPHTRGKIVLAQKTCYVLFREHLSLSQREIGRHFGRDQKVVQRAITEFNNLQPNKVKEDKEFFESYTRINTFIIDKKQQYISKHGTK